MATTNPKTGATLVQTGPSGAAKDRVLTTTDFTVNIRHRETWPVGLGPKVVTVRVTGTAAGVMSKFLFDEPDTAAADAQLAVVGGSGVTLPYKRVAVDSVIEQRTFVFDTPLQSLDFIANTGVTEVEILGV